MPSERGIERRGSVQRKAGLIGAVGNSFSGARLLGAGLTLLVLLLGPVEGAGGAVQAEFEKVIAETQRRVFPAVVFVKPILQSYLVGEKRKLIVYGSGVIISPEGHVVTNYHVVEKAIDIRCVLSDRREVSARVLGQDPEMDLAVLKLQLPEGESVPYAPFGDSDALTEGQFVLAMGAPFGFDRSVSLGIVSNTRRYLEISPYNLWIQTDAAINPGNSGGPLVNIRGEIVGINARGISSADNIGFAIPSNRVREVVGQILEHGGVRRSWTGLQLQPLNDFEKSVFIPADRGVMVAGVDPSSPAERAGLRTGDRLLEVAGRALRGLYREDLPEIRRFLASLKPGKAVQVKYVRAGVTRSTSLTPLLKGKVEGEDLELKEWDMTVKEISRYAQPVYAYFRPRGVFVQGVKSGGNADESGFYEGDILLEIDTCRVADLKGLKRLYRRLNTLPRGRRKVLCKVLRGGYPIWIVLDFERESQERARRTKAPTSAF